MRCTTCGREITNPDANYCDYCGSSLSGMEYREIAEAPKQQATETKETRVSTGLFLGVMFIPMIPFVGWILYLVLLFYWSFASSIQDSRKSFARANLIYTGIMLALAIIIICIACAFVFSELASVL